MALTIGIVRAAANPSTGTQDFTTTALGGETPKGALIIASRAITDGTAGDHASMCLGAVSGATQRWCCFNHSRNGQANTDETRRSMTDKLIAIPLAGGGIDGEADFDSWITNGIRINWTDAPASAFLITVILFAGSDINAYAGTVAPGTTVNGVTDVTAPNFPPDVVFMATPGNTFNDTADNFYFNGFGWCVRDGSNTQRSIFQSEEHNVAAGTPRAYVSTAYACGQPNNTSSSLVYGIEVGDFDSQGFSVTLRLASAGSDDVGYLALSVAGAGVWAGTIDTPTANGNQGYTGPGFSPQFILLGMTQLANVDSGIQAASAGPYGIAAITSGAQYANSVAIENAATTTNTQALSNDVAVDLPDDNGTSGIAATLVSLDVTGWTLNYSAVKGTARKFAALAIGSSPSGGKPWYAYAQQ